jgi:hypothetical protein
MTKDSKLNGRVHGCNRLYVIREYRPISKMFCLSEIFLTLPNVTMCKFCILVIRHGHRLNFLLIYYQSNLFIIV